MPDFSKANIKKTLDSPMFALSVIIVLFGLGYLKLCTFTFDSKESIRNSYLTSAKNCLHGALRQTENFARDFDRDRIYGAMEYYKEAIDYWEKAINILPKDSVVVKELKSNIRIYWSSAFGYDYPMPKDYE